MSARPRIRRQGGALPEQLAAFTVVVRLHAGDEVLWQGAERVAIHVLANADLPDRYQAAARVLGLVRDSRAPERLRRYVPMLESAAR